MNKLVLLLAAAVLTGAAGDEPGRYQVNRTDAMCLATPCANWRILDRQTGQMVTGDVELDLDQADKLDPVQLGGTGWDALVDGEMRQDLSSSGTPVLVIHKLVGRIATQPGRGQ